MSVKHTNEGRTFLGEGGSPVTERVVSQAHRESAGREMKARLEKLVPIAGLLILPFCFYWQLFAWDPAERKIFRGDFLNQHYVWKSYALERVTNGELPLWNPHVLGGVAFHANPQVGLFYPPNYLLIPFLTDGTVSYVALEAFQLLHQFLAGLGMWLFLRSLGLRRGAAWTGALVSMFTGFFTTPGHHALVLTAGWIPLNLFLAGRAVESTDKRSIAALAGGLCLMILAGHPQPAYYGALIVTAWAFYRAGWKGTLRRYVPALALGTLLASIQLLPTYQLATDSTREGAGYGYATTFEFSPYFLAGALVPRGQIPLPGHDPSAALHIYVGIGSLLLGTLAIAGSRRRERWFFVAVAGTALLLSMGSSSFLFDMAYTGLPGFSRFRIPFRILGLYTLVMAVLVGMGMDVLLSGVRHVRQRLALVAKGAFLLFVVLAAWGAYVHTSLVVSPGTLDPRQVERLVSSVNWALVLAAFNIIALAAVVWRPGRRWPAWAFTVLLIVDLGSFVKDRGQHPYETLVRADERPVHDLIRAQGYRSRYATGLNLESYSILHGTESAGGQDSLVDGRYAELLADSQQSANVLSLLNVKFVVRSKPTSDIVWCGPRYVSPLPLIDIRPSMSPFSLSLVPAIRAGHIRVTWTPLGDQPVEATLRTNATPRVQLSGNPWETRFDPPHEIEMLTVELREGGSGVRLESLEIDGKPLELETDFLDLGPIKLNLHALPRAYFATAREAEREEPVESLTCWTVEDPVRITDPGTGETWHGTFTAGLVEVARHEPEVVVLEVDSPKEGYVVFAETYRPGWRAEVDGEGSAVLRAQSAFRAVAVPAGRHRIELTYRPGSLMLGAVLSLLALLSLILLAASKRGRQP